MIGVIAVIVVAIVAAVTFYVYLRPPGQQTVSFQTRDAAALKAGEDVRVAGLKVGKIDSIELGTDVVTVTAEIENSVFVGDQSSVDVRMLTAVGGYFVTIIPAGDNELGDRLIPVSRVSIPYSIADVLQQVPRITDEVSGHQLDANIAQVASGLTDNSQSVGAMISGLDSIASIMDRQRGQVTQILDLAQSYLSTFNGNRGYVFSLVKKIEMVLTRYNITWAGFNSTYTLLGEVLQRLTPVSWYYYRNKDRLLTAVTAIREGFKNIQSQMNPVIDQLMAIQKGLTTMLGPDWRAKFGKNVVLATDVCVPVPGKRC